MNTYNIVCKLNENDDFSISGEKRIINLSNKNDYHYTFWDYRHGNKNLILMPNFFSNEGLDILYTSLFVYYADRVVKRDMYPDAWTREIKLFIPVLELVKWNNEKVLLEQLLSYLSGDKWEVEFRKRSLNGSELDFKTKQSNYHQPKLFDDEVVRPDKICMLSGGLDSYIGAIDLLEDANQVLFIGHYGGGKGVKEFQDKVSKSLIDEFSVSKDYFLNFHAAPLHGVEDTTRTRSFMFFSHALILATSFDSEIELYIPENGLISLNVPLTNSRLGSSSTRTTHPYYMKLLQKLITNLGIKVTLKNPYQFKTKGEMILECKNTAFLKKNISSTMSCSHPDQGRYNKERVSRHCGTCLPCVIRRASIKKGGVPETSMYRDTNFRSGGITKQNFNSYQLGIEKYKRKELKNFLKIQSSGPIDKNIIEYSNLYTRGMEEIIDLFEGLNS